MAYIGKTPVIGNFQVCDAITVVDAQAAYTMQVGGVNVSPESANHMLVSLNGILQAPTSSFTVSGSTITFASALETGDVIDFIQILGNVLDLGVPSDNTVSLAKLTATGTKDATTFLRGDNSFAGAGKVLQVVGASTNYSRTNLDHTTFVDVESSSGTSFVTSITPSSSSSKILILASIMSNNYQDSGEGDQRGFVSMLGDINGAGYSTLVNKSKTGGYAYGGTSYGVSVAQTTTYNFLWSPSTTSQCNVKFQFRPVGANGAMAVSGGTGGELSEITCNLLEVSA
jgi:hypothetical protein